MAKEYKQGPRTNKGFGHFFAQLKWVTTDVGYIIPGPEFRAKQIWLGDQEYFWLCQDQLNLTQSVLSDIFDHSVTIIN